MLRKLWLVFAQAVTVVLAVAFTIATLRPEWLPQRLPDPRPAPQENAQAERPPEAPVADAPKDSGPSRSAPLSYSEGAQRATAAVVNIYTSKTVRGGRQLLDPSLRRFFGDGAGERQTSSLGSGVIVSPDGYVLTNDHVVEGADEIEVTLSDSRHARARTIGTDPETDLAILKIELDKLPVIVLGNSDELAVGDIVLAIGNPFGVGQTVTSGIVSALGRSQLGINTFENFIQTDAAINPGNSGGALVDVDGNLMGINTAIYSRSGGSLGIGFAIPMSTARMVLDGIVREGKVTRGWIGVEPGELSPELAETFGVKATSGVIITGVLQDGPAALGGVRPGDVIVEVAGKPVGNVAALLSAVAALRPGMPAQFQVQRGNSVIALQLTPDVRPQPRRTRQR